MELVADDGGKEALAVGRHGGGVHGRRKEATFGKGERRRKDWDFMKKKEEGHDVKGYPSPANLQRFSLLFLSSVFLNNK